MSKPIWPTLARLLGIREDQVPDALVSERCARQTLSRRGLLVGAVTGSMLATGKGWSLPVHHVLRFRMLKITIDGVKYGIPVYE